MVLRNAVRISYRPVQQAFVKVGGHSLHCLAVDKELEHLDGHRTGMLCLADMTAGVDSQLDADSVKNQLVLQQYLHSLHYWKIHDDSEGMWYRYQSSADDQASKQCKCRTDKS